MVTNPFEKAELFRKQYESAASPPMPDYVVTNPSEFFGCQDDGYESQEQEEQEEDKEQEEQDKEQDAHVSSPASPLPPAAPTSLHLLTSSSPSLSVSNVKRRKCICAFIKRRSRRIPQQPQE